MKRLLLGILIGFILATTTFGFAATNSIRLIINGQEVPCDPPPQMIQGRVFVPVRFVAEALSVNVGWDQENNAVIIKSLDKEDLSETQIKDKSMGWISLHEIRKNYELSGYLSHPSKGMLLTAQSGISIVITKQQQLKMGNGEIIDATVTDSSGKEIGKVRTKVESGRTYFYKDDLLRVGFPE